MMGFAFVLLLSYLASILVRQLLPGSSGFVGNGTLALELVLDVIALGLAAKLARVHDAHPSHSTGDPVVIRKRGLALRLIQWSFVATLISTINFQILSRFFGVKLPDTMGTWLELEINAPYLGFFALAAGALLLIIKASASRSALIVSICLSCAVTVLIFLFSLVALNMSGFPLQNRIIHIIAFVITGIIFGTGIYLAINADKLANRWISLGFMSMASSGMLFQWTEIFKKLQPMDLTLETTWIMGQFSIVFALLSEYNTNNLDV